MERRNSPAPSEAPARPDPDGASTRSGPLVLVGNPNVGKSVIFAYLTGRYATVSNYPGTTVEISKGRAFFDSSIEVIDTPGANSLHPHSVDEKVTRDILLESKPRFVVQVVDAKNLRRGLTITTQLAEMGLPVVLVLNMMDEAASRGLKISGATLSEKIGVPVVETVAIEKKGLKQLVGCLSGVPGIPRIEVHYPERIEEGIERISGLLPDFEIARRSVALMMLSNPGEALSSLGGRIDDESKEKILETVSLVQAEFSNPLGYIIGVSRSRVVDRLLDAVFMRDIRELGEMARSRIRRKQAFFSLGLTALSFLAYLTLGMERLGVWGLHPLLIHLVLLSFIVTVLPYAALEKLTTHRFLGVIFLFEILYLMYNFVGVFGAGTLVDLLEIRLFGDIVVPSLETAFKAAVPWGFPRDLLLGEYGLISMGLTYAIAIVMPIVATFFLAFGILEDSGYLPRLSVVADRAMRRIGLNGRAVLPMVLGLGCATMATLTTRILDSRKERVIATLLLALAIPCSAQLGVIVAIVSQSSFWVMAAVVLVVLSQLFLVGTLSSKLIKGEVGDFIVELPPLRPPQFVNIVTKTLYRLKWFLFEAVPLFLLGTFILFLVDKLGGFAAVERVARPVVVKLLGLPIEATIAFIMGFFRRDYGAAGLFDLFRQGMLSNNQVVVSMVVITLFVPCIANFFVIVKERGLRTALLMVGFIFPYAILVGALVNLVLSTARINL